MTKSKWLFLFACVTIMLASCGQDNPTEPGSQTTDSQQEEYRLIAKWGEKGSAKGQFNLPYGIAVDKDGNVYVADTENERIQKFTSDGEFLAKWGEEGTGIGKFNFPRDLAVDRQGNIYVADPDNYCVQKISPYGEFLKIWDVRKRLLEEIYIGPWNIDVDMYGNVYVSEGSSSILVFSSEGMLLNKWGPGNSISQFAVDNKGNIYITNNSKSCIWKFTTDGNFLKKWDGYEDEDFKLYSPSAIAADDIGNIYFISDSNIIVKIGPEGKTLAEWGNTWENKWENKGYDRLYHPAGIAVDSAGNVYIADSWNYCIKKFAKK